jgi:hypothetical protein
MRHDLWMKILRVVICAFSVLWVAWYTALEVC